MSLGNNLFNARKKQGLSQEEVADKLGVSRQTISKWETDETLPDIQQAKKLSFLYRVSLDELIEFDYESKEIEKLIENTDEKLYSKINWTNLWSKKYPILSKYHEEIQVDKYAYKIENLLNEFRNEYGYTDTDTFLIFKDILFCIFNNKKK